MMKHKKYTSAIATALALSIPAASGAISITSDDFSFTDSFTGFDGTIDPANWTTADDTGAASSAWQGSGDGSSNTGGKYSFGDSGSGADFNGSLGFLPSSSRAITGTIDFVVDAGVSVPDIVVGYTAEHWRSANDGRLNGWAVSWTLNGVDQGDLADLTYVASNSLATGSNPAGGPWEAVNLSATLSSPLEAGDEISFVFFGDNGTGGGSRQGVAVDDFTLTAVPEPAISILGGLGLLGLLRRRR